MNILNSFLQAVQSFTDAVWITLQGSVERLLDFLSRVFQHIINVPLRLIRFLLNAFSGIREFIIVRILRVLRVVVALWQFYLFIFVFVGITILLYKWDHFWGITLSLVIGVLIIGGAIRNINKYKGKGSSPIKYTDWDTYSQSNFAIKTFNISVFASVFIFGFFFRDSLPLPPHFLLLKNYLPFVKTNEELVQSCNESDYGACVAIAKRIEEDNNYGGLSGALPFYEKACDGGEASGCHRLGVVAYTGNSVKQDKRLAASFFMRACNEKYGVACHNLAEMHRVGDGVELDNKVAASLFRAGCKSGSAKSCQSLNKYEYLRE
jgi:hypothetical protein